MGSKKQLELAAQQLIGYAHGKRGYSVTQLAEAMGLSAREWEKLRDDVTLPKGDAEELDDYFARRN